jgi:hypothetical protein
MSVTCHGLLRLGIGERSSKPAPGKPQKILTM